MLWTHSPVVWENIKPNYDQQTLSVCQTFHFCACHWILSSDKMKALNVEESVETWSWKKHLSGNITRDAEGTWYWFHFLIRLNYICLFINYVILILHLLSVIWNMSVWQISSPQSWEMSDGFMCRRSSRSRQWSLNKQTDSWQDSIYTVHKHHWTFLKIHQGSTKRILLVQLSASSSHFYLPYQHFHSCTTIMIKNIYFSQCYFSTYISVVYIYIQL